MEVELGEVLRVFQHEQQDIVQFTDGRPVHTLEEYRAGWHEHPRIEATVEAVERISARSPSSILEEVAREGWAQISRFEVQEEWKRRWVRE